MNIGLDVVAIIAEIRFGTLSCTSGSEEDSVGQLTGQGLSITHIVQMSFSALEVVSKYCEDILGCGVWTNQLARDQSS